MRKTAFAILSMLTLFSTLFLSNTSAQDDDEGDIYTEAETLDLGGGFLGLGIGTGGVINHFGDVDYFKVEVRGRARGELLVYSSNLFTSIPTDLVGQLRDANDRHLATSTNDGRGPNFRIVYTVDPGIYYIRVTELNNDATGSYRLHAYFTPIPESIAEYPTLMSEPEEAVRCVAYSSNGEVLVAGDNAGKIHVLDPSTLDPPITWENIETIGEGRDYGDVRSIAFSPDDEWCAAGTAYQPVGSKGGYLLVWKRVGQSPIDYTWDKPVTWMAPQKIELKETVRSVAFNYDSNYLACGTDGDKVYVYEIENEEWVSKKELNHPDNVTSVAWHPTENQLASGCDDRHVRLWVDPLTESEPTKEYTGGVHCVAFSPDGERFVAGSQDGSIELWSVKSNNFVEPGEEPWISEWSRDFDTNYKHAGAVLSLAFHPTSGHVLVSCGDDKTIRFWDVHTLTFLSELIVDSKISSSTFNPLGNTLAIGTEGDRRTLIFGEHIPPRLYQFEYSGTIGFANKKNFKLNFPSDLVSQVAYGRGNATYFVLNLQRPTLIKDSNDTADPIYEDCVITLDLPDVQQLPVFDSDSDDDRLTEPLYYMYSLQTPCQRIEVVEAEGRADTQVQVATYVVGTGIGVGIGFAIGSFLPAVGNIAGATAGAVVGKFTANVIGSIAGNLVGIGIRNARGARQASEAQQQILAETADPFFLIQPTEQETDCTLTNYRVLFLIKKRITEIGITVQQAYRLEGEEVSDKHLYVAKYTHTWDLEGGSWSATAPPAQPVSLEHYPPFQMLPPEEQTYLLRYFEGAVNMNANPETWQIPAETSLLRNYPNPFNPETWIPYQLSEPADVTLTIYDIQGRVVRNLDLGHQRAGIYRSRGRAAHWDGRNTHGESVASGLYFYTLTAGDFVATRKMLIRK